MISVFKQDKSTLSVLRQRLASSMAKNIQLERALTEPGGTYAGEPVADLVYGMAHAFTMANRALALPAGIASDEPRYAVSSCQVQLPVVFYTQSGQLRATPVAPESKVNHTRVGLITLDLGLTPPPTPTAGISSAYATISMPGDGNGWHPNDVQRMLRHEGGGIWVGRVWLSTEQYKFAANRSWLINWGEGGTLNGANHSCITTPGLYAITFDENDPGRPLLVLLDESGACSMEFVCTKAYTQAGESVFVVGSIAELGSWNPQNALRLSSERYPSWKGTITGLPSNTRFEWKHIVRQEAGDKKVVVWEGGANHVATTGQSGFSGSVTGTL